MLKAYIHLKVLGFPLNYCETRGYPGLFSDISILTWRKSLRNSHSRPSEWKTSSEGNGCSLPQSCLKFISPVLSRILLFFYVVPFLFLVMSLGKVTPFYLILVVPQVRTFEHYKVAVEWPQGWVSLPAPPLTPAFRLTSSHCSCSQGFATTLGQYAVPGRAIVLMLLLSLLFYIHFFCCSSSYSLCLLLKLVRLLFPNMTFKVESQKKCHLQFSACLKL